MIAAAVTATGRSDAGEARTPAPDPRPSHATSPPPTQPPGVGVHNRLRDATSYEVAHSGQTRYLTVIPIVVFALDGAASPTSAALRLLAEHGLAERGPVGWRRGAVALADVAESTGAADLQQEREDRYRQDRESWPGSGSIRVPARCL